MSFSKVSIYALLLVFVFGLLSLVGCGGGTEGTGGVTIEGRVLDIASQPLVGVEVKVTDTNDTDLTDAQGSFAVIAGAAISTATLAFVQSGTQAISSIESIPVDTESITATFTVDFSKKVALANKVEFKKKKSSSNSDTNSGAGPGITPTPDDDSDDKGGDDGHGGSSKGDDDDEPDDNGGSSNSGGSGSNSGTGGGSNSGSGGGSGSSSSQKREVTGIISAISSSVIVVAGVSFVPTASTEYKDRDGRQTSISGISVGQVAKAKGQVIDGILILEKLEIEEEEEED